LAVECTCICGTVKVLRAYDVINGRTKSCNCMRYKGQEGIRKGDFRKEHRAWEGMQRRCYNPKYEGFHNYGGRGITVCDKWRGSFLAFLNDMGLAPTKDHSLDRINNDGNYEPGNCRWATRAQQTQNKRKRKDALIEYRGEKKTLQGWCDEFNIGYKTAHGRLTRLKLPLDMVFRKINYRSHRQEFRKALDGGL
jgi:hypothetical protein